MKNTPKARIPLPIMNCLLLFILFLLILLGFIFCKYSVNRACGIKLVLESYDGATACFISDKICATDKSS